MFILKLPHTFGEIHRCAGLRPGILVSEFVGVILAGTEELESSICSTLIKAGIIEKPIKLTKETGSDEAWFDFVDVRNVYWLIDEEVPF